MGSIQDNFDFEEWKKVHDHFWDSDLTGYHPSLDNLGTCIWKGHMITFEQVAKIEALRRQIQGLQEMLSNQANYTMFGWADLNNKWHGFENEVNKILRETVCKVTVAKILKLLDESERLGVDVSKSKETLLEFLEEIKPKENADELC